LGISNSLGILNVIGDFKGHWGFQIRWKFHS
jgi:hypothetical protein